MDPNGVFEVSRAGDSGGMAERIEEFTVVGGGTAGWVAALSLSTFLNRYREGPPVRVTLIESPKVPTIGVGEASLDASLKYAKERVQFGKPIGSFQRVQDMIVEMAVEMEAARLLTLKAAYLWENNIPSQKHFSMAKLYATEAGKKATDLGVQIHGGYGFMDEYPVSRY